MPVNLYLDEDVVGPISLNAVNFITLGIPLSSESGDATVESFSLTDGYLSEQSGLQVSFSPVSENEWATTDSSVLKAGESHEPSIFGVDLDGYLVSVTPLSNNPSSPPLKLVPVSVVLGVLTLRVVSDGSYVADRIKFFACPNEEQDDYGGGEYKVFSNNAPDPEKCLPIYLGVKCNESPLPHLNKSQQSGGSAPAPAPPSCHSCETCEIIPPLVTQIWDGQVGAPPTPSPTAPCPASVQPVPVPRPSSPPGPRTVPAPSPTTWKDSPPQPPIVTQIGDGQLQAHTAMPVPTSPAPAPYVPVPAPVPYPPRPPPPAPVSAVFQGSGTRIRLNGFPRWTRLLVLVAIRLIL